MKRQTIFVILICIISSTLNAKKNKFALSKIFLQAGAGGTSFGGSNGDIVLQTIFKNKWSASVSYASLDMKPKNQPADYQSESGVAPFFLLYSNEVRSKMNMVSFKAGKYFPVGKKCWLTTEAGLPFVNGEKISYQPITRQNSDPLWYLPGVQSFSSSYKTGVEEVNTIGGMIRADLNWAITSFMGLGTGVFANLNSIQSPVGLRLTLSFGWMNTGKNHENR